MVAHIFALAPRSHAPVSLGVGRKFNILMIAPTPFFADYGCHVRILEEARTLQGLGHRVVICAYPNGGDVPGLSIERVRNIQGENAQVGSAASAQFKILCDMLLFFASLGLARRFRPDVIHAHLHEGALVGWLLGMVVGKPLVFDFQGSLTDEMVNHRFLRRDGPFYRPMGKVEWLIDHLPRAIIVNSRHAADLLAGGFGCDGRRIHIIPDCVNSDVFRPWWEWSAAERAALKAQLGIPSGRRVIVYLGLLAEYQGIPHLLQAAKYLIEKGRDEAHFLIMGYPGEEHYRAMARDLGLGEHVTFTGRIPYAEAPRYLALGDIAVAPKISASEGSGKLLNYMATALPIAAFATAVSREYLGDYGVYARVGDPVSLAEAIGWLLNNEEQAVELGRRLRERAVREYSWAGAVRRLVEIYDRLVNHHNGESSL